MNVEKLLKDFEKKLSFGITTYSKNTIISYVDDVRLYLVKNSFEHLKIEELFSENKIINYFEMLLTSDVDKYKKSSAKRKLSSISKFIDFLVDRQIISSNFMKTLDKKILLGNKIEINKVQKNQTEIKLDNTSKEIISILDEYIKPAVSSDGGNILFESYNPKKKLVKVILQGACSGCPSSTITLKNGIENMLKEMLSGKVEVVEAING